VLLVLEDLHDADRGTLDLLVHRSRCSDSWCSCQKVSLTVRSRRRCAPP
jgi:hypothetical protein